MGNGNPQKPGIFTQTDTALQQHFARVKFARQEGRDMPPPTTLQFHAENEKDAFAMATLLSMAYVMQRVENLNLGDTEVFGDIGKLGTLSIKPGKFSWNKERNEATVVFPFSEQSLGGAAFATEMRGMVGQIGHNLFGPGREQRMMTLNTMDDKGKKFTSYAMPVNKIEVANCYFRVLHAIDLARGEGKSGNDGLYATETLGVILRGPDGKKVSAEVSGVVIDEQLYGRLAKIEAVRGKSV